MAGLVEITCWCLVLNLGLLTALPTEPQLGHGNSEDVFTKSQTASLITGAGYPQESHRVATSDGYLLTLHRIPHGKGAPSGVRRTPVFIMHGLTGTSSAFVQQAPEFALGFNLADAGYDVWLGNARGNRQSRAHATLDPDTDAIAFFDFSWEEIGLRDLPAMIDYVLTTTAFDKLHYIGHSQGGTAFLVLNSMLPEYNDKFYSAHLLAGVGYMAHFPDIRLATISQSSNEIYALALSYGVVEVVRASFTVNSLTDLLFPRSRTNVDCNSTDAAVQPFCNTVTMMRNNEQPDVSNIISQLAGANGGASIKQFAHYGQNIASKLFRRWDLGPGNVQAYGTEAPPLYNLSLITVNTTMHYTVSDYLVDERDVLAMVDAMPNAVARKVARETFTHSDFIITDDAKELVNDYIIEAFGYMEEEINGEIDPITPPNVPDSSTTLSLGVLLQVYLIAYILNLL
ncbi:lipase 3 [Plutella xylostella]|uniref:lipase 3 n=1 Tax=Plutella xylostella TaxID=51655 RepID=UPI002032E56E|nr:lipase 3 [Plutella xylostella]